VKKNYFEYLKERSWKGKLYRNYFLYPILSKYFKKEDYILDFGCGIGDYLEFRKNTVGADINEDNVAYCNSNGLEAKIIQDNKIDFGNEVFAGVMMDNVLEHIVDPAESIKEITRVLKKNGLLLVGVPGAKGFNRDIDHKIFYSEESLVSLMNQKGYEYLKTVYTPFLIDSDYLSNNLKIYCVYVLFKKI